MAYQPFMPKYLREKAEGRSTNLSNFSNFSRGVSDQDAQNLATLATLAGGLPSSGQAASEGEVGVSSSSTTIKYNNNYNVTICLEDSQRLAPPKHVGEGGAAKVANLANVRSGDGSEEPAKVANPAKVGHRCCACGALASHATGWFLRGPGGAKWYCGACVPSREEIISVAGGIGEPSLPADGPACLDWWRQPVEGWASGRLEIRNMLTGVTTVLDLRSG